MKNQKRKKFWIPAVVVVLLVLIALGAEIWARNRGARKEEALQQIPIRWGFEFKYDDWTFCVENLGWYDGTSIQQQIEGFKGIADADGKAYAPEQIKVALVQFMVFSNRPGEEYDGSRIFDLENLSFGFGDEKRSWSSELMPLMPNWFYQKFGSKLPLKEDEGQTVVFPVLFLKPDVEADIWENLEKEDLRIRIKGYPVEFVMPLPEDFSYFVGTGNSAQKNSEHVGNPSEGEANPENGIRYLWWQEPVADSETGLQYQIKSMLVTRKTGDRDRNRIAVGSDAVYDEEGNLTKSCKRVFAWLTMEVTNCTEQAIETQVDFPIAVSDGSNKIFGFGPSPVYMAWETDGGRSGGAYGCRLEPKESRIYEIGYFLDTDWVFEQFGRGGRLYYKAGHGEEIESVNQLWDIGEFWDEFVSREGRPPVKRER